MKKEESKAVQGKQLTMQDYKEVFDLRFETYYWIIATVVTRFKGFINTLGKIKSSNYVIN